MLEQFAPDGHRHPLWLDKYQEFTDLVKRVEALEAKGKKK